jgi:hypothetical protein
MRKDLFEIEQDEHRGRVFDAIAGYHRGHKQGKIAKPPCRTINKQTSSIVGLEDAMGKRLDGDKRQDDTKRLGTIGGEAAPIATRRDSGGVCCKSLSNKEMRGTMYYPGRKLIKNGLHARSFIRLFLSKKGLCF